MLIEDKVSGTSLLQELRSTGFYKAKAFKPEGDKITRLSGVTPTIEGGRVLLPHSASWLADFEEELCAFPAVRHDDQVDSLSQALHWLRDEGYPGGIFFYIKQESDKATAHREHRNVKLRAPSGGGAFLDRDGARHRIGADGILWLSEESAGSAVSAGFKRLNHPAS